MLGSTITFRWCFSLGILFMMPIITSIEAMRQQGTRYEVYRLAVEAGFYNEGPETVVYKGYQITPDEGAFSIIQHGAILTRMQNLYVSKVWIACRVHKCGLIAANTIVKEGN